MAEARSRRGPSTRLPAPLTLEASSPALTITSQDPGFFTTVSSNGTSSNTAIIWAIGRPTGTDYHITLYAFNGTRSGTTLPLLWSGSAGTWPNVSGNANLVPTVANGQVYVGSYRQLAIFGVTSPAAQIQAKLQQPPPVPPQKPAGALFWGMIKSIDNSRIVLVLRTGELLQVDLSQALRAGTTVEPIIGRNVAVNGNLNERVSWKPASCGAPKGERVGGRIVGVEGLSNSRLRHLRQLQSSARR